MQFKGNSEVLKLQRGSCFYSDNFKAEGTAFSNSIHYSPAVQPSTHSGFQNVAAARKPTGSLAGKSTGYLRCEINRIISQTLTCGKVKYEKNYVLLLEGRERNTEEKQYFQICVS